MKTKELKRRATIKDVANLAGCSPSTVSFVMNNTKGQTISEETRAHILECARRLEYRPHYYATQIRRGTARTIAVLSTYRIQAMYFLDMINGIMAEATNLGYGVILCPNNREKEPKLCLDYFQEGRIDGVVFISSAHSEETSMESEYISYFQENQIPFTVVYGYTHFDNVCYSNADFYGNGRDVTRLLIERGCRSIHYIGALDKYNQAQYNPQTEQDRLNGYLDVMREAGLTPKLTYLPRNFRSPDHQELVQSVIREPTDAYYICWATLGLQMLSLLRDLGRRIPMDTKVIASDTLPYLDSTVPSLSAVRIPFNEMASYATRSLIQILDGADELPESKSFKGILELRESL